MCKCEQIYKRMDMAEQRTANADVKKQQQFSRSMRRILFKQYVVASDCSVSGSFHQFQQTLRQSGVTIFRVWIDCGPGLQVDLFELQPSRGISKKDIMHIKQQSSNITRRNQARWMIFGTVATRWVNIQLALQFSYSGCDLRVMFIIKGSRITDMLTYKVI